jgi:nitrite reductase (NO-forming)
MNNIDIPKLSELLERRDGAGSNLTDRRSFLKATTAMPFAIAGLGSALSACSDSKPDRGDNGNGTPPTNDSSAGDATKPHASNADSRLDTVLQHGPPGSAAAASNGTAQNVAFHPYAPELPPAPASSVQKIHWHARHAPIRIDSNTVVDSWTFEGDVPGPIVHTRVGDTVEFTLTNDEAMPHSMDFHAAQVDPKTAFRSIPKGESISFTFKPKYAGAFMYHCGTAPVLLHIGSGMYGAIIVSPREGLPAAREFVLVQSEHYVTEPQAGMCRPDYNKMMSMQPDFVSFNGRPNQYIAAPLKVKLGERVRFWVVNAGPSHPCNFHVVGEQFDTMYLGSPPGSPVRGVQTWAIAPGGGMCFELLCDVRGEFPFVNHGFGHGQKGGIGILLVE